MTSRGPQEGDIMNFLEGDSEVKFHLPRLSISGWKSNGKPTKIQQSSKSSINLQIIKVQNHPQNPFSLSIPFKIPTIQHHPQDHKMEASSSKASKSSIEISNRHA